MEEIKEVEMGNINLQFLKCSLENTVILIIIIAMFALRRAKQSAEASIEIILSWSWRRHGKENVAGIKVIYQLKFIKVWDHLVRADIFTTCTCCDISCNDKRLSVTTPPPPPVPSAALPLMLLGPSSLAFS